MIFTAMFAVGGFLGSILDDTSIMPLAIFLLVMAMGCWASLYRF